MARGKRTSTASSSSSSSKKKKKTSSGDGLQDVMNGLASEASEAPEQYLVPSDAKAAAALEATKVLYDAYAAGRLASGQDVLVPELLVAGMDNEQVWAQLSMATRPLLNHANKALKRLSSQVAHRVDSALERAAKRARGSLGEEEDDFDDESDFDEEDEEGEDLDSDDEHDELMEEGVEVDDDGESEGKETLGGQDAVGVDDDDEQVSVGSVLDSGDDDDAESPMGSQNEDEDGDGDLFELGGDAKEGGEGGEGEGELDAEEVEMGLLREAAEADGSKPPMATQGEGPSATLADGEDTFFRFEDMDKFLDQAEEEEANRAEGKNVPSVLGRGAYGLDFDSDEEEDDEGEGGDDEGDDDDDDDEGPPAFGPGSITWSAEQSAEDEEDARLMKLLEADRRRAVAAGELPQDDFDADWEGVEGADDGEEGPADDDDIRYEDFFSAPKTGVKAAPAEKRVRFDNDDEEDDGIRHPDAWSDDDSDESDDDGVASMDEVEEEGGKSKGMRGALGDEESASTDNLSAYQKNQKAMSDRIAEMEDELLKPKSWAMSGEVSGKKRPRESLLATALDHEGSTKRAPVVSDVTTESLEDMIRKRIKEVRWDDPVPVSALKAADAIKPRKRGLAEDELDMEQNKEGLANVYEKQYLKATGQLKDSDPLARVHRGIIKDFKALSYRLDALTNFHFMPDPDMEEPTVRPNVAALAMEEAMPISVSRATLVAPEEVAAPARSAKVSAGETETSQAERKAARAAKKAAKRKSKAAKEAEERIVARLNPGLGNKHAKSKALNELRQGRLEGVSQVGHDVGTSKSSALFSKLQAEAQSDIAAVVGAPKGKGKKVKKTSGGDFML